MIKKLQEYRADLYVIENTIKGLAEKSAETTLAMRAVQLSHMWMGKLLAVRNESSPYSTGQAIDRADFSPDVIKLQEHLPLSQFRLIIQEKIDEVGRFLDALPVYGGPRERNIRWDILKYLTECKMWLGEAHAILSKPKEDV
jgi:hypothetical protein